MKLQLKWNDLKDEKKSWRTSNLNCALSNEGLKSSSPKLHLKLDVFYGVRNYLQKMWINLCSFNNAYGVSNASGLCGYYDPSSLILRRVLYPAMISIQAGMTMIMKIGVMLVRRLLIEELM